MREEPEGYCTAFNNICPYWDIVKEEGGCGAGLTISLHQCIVDEVLTRRKEYACLRECKETSTQISENFNYPRVLG